MENETEEGMSTGKKVVAGAAIGVAVPAAVGVAKKLLSNGDERQEQVRSRASAGVKSASNRARSAAGSSRKTAASRGKKATSSARKTAGSAKRTAGRKARSTSRSASRSASRGSGRTKEQLYNQAKRLNIEGRSSMTKAQLEHAISRKRS